MAECIACEGRPSGDNNPCSVCGLIVGAENQLNEAACVLAEFAKTAPGRLPKRVQDAIAFVAERLADPPSLRCVNCPETPATNTKPASELVREPFKLNPPPIYDEHYAATQDADGVSVPDDCGEAGHAEGRCGNAQCLPSTTAGAWSAPEEEVYQRIKARLIEELVVSAPDLRTMGLLQEHGGKKNG